MRKSRLVVLLLVLGLLAAACGRSGSDDNNGQSSGQSEGSTSTTAAETNAQCKKEPLQSTEVGVTPTEITVQVMADTGSSLAPGLFQGNIDAMTAFAAHVNKTGGIGCRKLVVKTWDSKLSPEETKNGLINACRTALAMVGDNSLFNPDPKPMTDCVDKAGTPTGVPNLAALANDTNEQCAPTTFLIQGVSEHCPIPASGPRTFSAHVGPARYYLSLQKDLHGIYMVPGDLPTTVQSATYQIAAMEKEGIKWDATPKVSGRDEQAAFTPRIQQLKATNGTFVYNGSNDRAMVNMRKEAKAQGLNTVKVWACSLACYTRNMLSSGGPDVDGTYVWMQFLPFEEKSENPELAAYMDSVGDNKADSFGAQAWQAGALFKQVVDEIVKTDGPNAITRAKMLEVLKNTKDFTANGWMGKKDLRGFSPCFLVMQIKGGKFVRVYPTEKGTMDCKTSNLVEVTFDPVVEAAKIK